MFKYVAEVWNWKSISINGQIAKRTEFRDEFWKSARSDPATVHKLDVGHSSAYLVLHHRVARDPKLNDRGRHVKAQNRVDKSWRKRGQQKQGDCALVIVGSDVMGR